MASTIKIPMSQVMKQVTLRMVVTGMARARFRIWLGAWIVRLASVVMGCAIDLVMAPEAESDEPPRSLRNDVRDPAFKRWVGRLDVLLDGEVQRDVAAYDIDAGIVERAKRNAQDMIVIIGDEVKTERLVGAVEVRLRDEPSA